MRSILSFSSAIAIALGASAGGVARADDPVLLVTVDSEDGDVDGRAVRTALADRVDLRIVSLLDPDATSSRASLVVGVARGGRRIELCYQDTAGRRRFDETVGSGAGLAAVVDAAAAFLARIFEESVWSIPSEVLDPFEPPEQRPQRRGPSEVIDPWEVPWARGRAGEAGRQLGAPPRERHNPPRR